MKEKLIAEIHKILQNKLSDSLSNYNQIQEALLNDSKSSAGDKHETARAMAQIELERAGKQLHETQKLLQTFNQVNFQAHETVKLGSLVLTSDLYFFISIPLGKLEIESKEIYCFGTQAPFCKEILGKKIGDTFLFSNVQHEITSIF
ncbi:MAG: hypothetical protein ACK5B9_04680 [Flavobacteriia bacterium]|jgi:ElaB/YqjD/DUF883 family membrane-anchored ribosome-binding protein